MSNHLIICLIVLQASCNPGESSTSQTTVTAEQLLADMATGNPVAYRDMTIEGDVNLTHVGTAQLTPGTLLATINAPLYFERCQFTGKIIGFEHHGDTVRIARFTSAVSFQNCRFEDEVDLRGGTFDHHLYLNTSLFDQQVQMQAVRIGGDLRLEKAVFSGDFLLQEAVIKGSCWAKEASILGQFSVQQADFWQNAVFAGMSVQGYADFGLAHFRQSAFFEYGKYSDRVNYSGAIFRHRAEWTKAHFEKDVDLRNSWFSIKPVFSGVVKNDSINLGGARFDGGGPDNEP